MDIEALGDPGAQELLASPQPIRLAYAGRDGFPRVVPVGFLWKDERVYVCGVARLETALKNGMLSLLSQWPSFWFVR